MSTSYLFAYYILDSQISFSSFISINKDLFYFLFSVLSLLRFLVLHIITVFIMENFKKIGTKYGQIKKNNTP